MVWVLPFCLQRINTCIFSGGLQASLFVVSCSQTAFFLSCVGGENFLLYVGFSPPTHKRKKAVWPCETSLFGLIINVYFLRLEGNFIC